MKYGRNAFDFFKKMYEFAVLRRASDFVVALSVLIFFAVEASASCGASDIYRRDIEAVKTWTKSALFEISSYAFVQYPNGQKLRASPGDDVVEIYEIDRTGPILIDIKQLALPAAAKRLRRSQLIESGARLLISDGHVVILLADDKNLRRAECLLPDAVFIEQTPGHYQYRPPANSKIRASHIYEQELFDLLSALPQDIKTYSNEQMVAFDSDVEASASRVLNKADAAAPKYKTNFVLQNTSQNAVLSALHLSREAYRLSESFKDSADLFYQSDFKASLPGRVLLSTPELIFRLEMFDDKSRNRVSVHYKNHFEAQFNANLSFALRRDALEFGEAYLGYRDFATDQWFVDARGGYFSDIGWSAVVSGVLFDLSSGQAVSLSGQITPARRCETCDVLRNVGLYHQVLTQVPGFWSIGYELGYRDQEVELALRSSLALELNNHSWLHFGLARDDRAQVTASFAFDVQFNKHQTTAFQAGLSYTAHPQSRVHDVQINDMMSVIYKHARVTVARKWPHYMKF